MKNRVASAMPQPKAAPDRYGFAAFDAVNILRYGKRMNAIRKITAHIPEPLLEKAQSFSGEGVTETIRRALEAYTIAEWSRQFAALRGKVHLDIDIDALREDREFDELGNLVE